MFNESISMFIEDNKIFPQPQIEENYEKAFKLFFNEAENNLNENEIYEEMPEAQIFGCCGAQNFGEMNEINELEMSIPMMEDNKKNIKVVKEEKEEKWKLENFCLYQEEKREGKVEKGNNRIILGINNENKLNEDFIENKNSRIDDFLFDSLNLLPIVQYEPPSSKMISLQEEDEEKEEKIKREKIEKNNRTTKNSNPLPIFATYSKIRQRKLHADDIRRKLKARSHKAIRLSINYFLQKAGAEKNMKFKSLCPTFISCVTREKNKEILEFKYKDILKKDFIKDISKTDEKKVNKKKLIQEYEHNLEVLEYLEKNEEIRVKSGFDLIGDMLYKDLLNEYFNSEDFIKSIEKLREEKESEEYIQEYLIKAKNYVSFFEGKSQSKKEK